MRKFAQQLHIWFLRTQRTVPRAFAPLSLVTVHVPAETGQDRRGVPGNLVSDGVFHEHGRPKGRHGVDEFCFEHDESKMPETELRVGTAGWHPDGSTEAGRRRRPEMRGPKSGLKPPEDMRAART